MVNCHTFWRMANCHIQGDISSNPALTVAEVADQLKTSSRTVQRWIKDGRLRAIRLPGGRGRYRIYQHDIDEAITVIEATA